MVEIALDGGGFFDAINYVQITGEEVPSVTGDMSRVDHLLVPNVDDLLAAASDFKTALNSYRSMVLNDAAAFSHIGTNQELEDNAQGGN